MPRWPQDGKARLERAALSLFAEKGYDETTVADIAARAQLTKSTFFRHFSDKREVLFGGPDLLSGRFAEAIATAPPTASLVTCLGLGLKHISPGFTTEVHELATQRVAVVAAHSELKERELLKRAHLATAITDSLRARGVDGTTAALAAEIGVLAFIAAYERWSDADNQEGFEDLASQALSRYVSRAARLRST